MEWQDAEIIQPEENRLVICEALGYKWLIKAYYQDSNWYDTKDEQIQVLRWKELASPEK